MKLNFNQDQKKLRKRIVKIAYKTGNSHLGSSLNTIDLINEIFLRKKKNDSFVLSYGHSAIALYAVLEKHGLMKNSEVLSTHPDRDLKKGIEVSTGSLGQGLPIALGMALADRNKTVYCIISDGECSEGSIWETLRGAFELKVSNLKIILGANGYGAYDRIEIKFLARRIKGFGFKIIKINGHSPGEIKKALKKQKTEENCLILARTTSEQFPFLRGIDAHYHKMTEEEYKKALILLQ